MVAIYSLAVKLAMEDTFRNEHRLGTNGLWQECSMLPIYTSRSAH
jgi:hypothetical protein